MFFKVGLVVNNFLEKLFRFDLKCGHVEQNSNEGQGKDNEYFDLKFLGKIRGE